MVMHRVKICQKLGMRIFSPFLVQVFHHLLMSLLSTVSYSVSFWSRSLPDIYIYMMDHISQFSSSGFHCTVFSFSNCTRVQWLRDYFWYFLFFPVIRYYTNPYRGISPMCVTSMQLPSKFSVLNWICLFITSIRVLTLKKEKLEIRKKLQKLEDYSILLKSLSL